MALEGARRTFVNRADIFALNVVPTYIKRQSPIMFDTETTGLNPRTNKLVSLQFMQRGHNPVIMDVRRLTSREQQTLTTALNTLVSGGLLWVGHNICFDYEMLLQHYGVKLTRMFDTMLAEKIIQGGISEDLRYDLAAVCERYHLDISKEERKWFYNLDTRPDDWIADFPDTELDYMARDVEVLEPLFQAQSEALLQRGLTEVAKLEFACIRPVAMKEMKGIHVDKDAWRAFIKVKEQEALEAESTCIEAFGATLLRDRIEKFDALFARWQQWNESRQLHEAHLRETWDTDPGLQRSLWDGWGQFKQQGMQKWREQHPNPGKPTLPYRREKGEQEIDYLRFSEAVNIGSPEQMKVAFRLLNIPLPLRRNEKGEMKESLREEDLVRVADDFPIVSTYIKYKKKRKFVDSFGERFLEQIDVDGRIHTHINQIVSTGRVSSSSPNLQNLPARGEDGQELRKCILAPPGYKLITNDYAGIEDRICCFLSGDPVLRSMYDEGKDVHHETAKLLFRCADEAVRVPRDNFGGQTYRDVAKTFRYASLYGAYPTKLAKRLHCTVDEATWLYNQFRSLFSVTFQWLDMAQQRAQRELVTRTILGRPRYATSPTKPLWGEYGGDSAAYRTALREFNSRQSAIARELTNHCIQGTSADMTKQALVNLYPNLPDEAAIVLFVHDEIAVEAPDELAEYCGALLERAMLDAAERFLPGFPRCCASPTISQSWEH